MSYRFTPDDIDYLRSEAGTDALESPAPFTEATLLADLTAVRRIAGDHAGAVAETITLRRRATERWAAQADDSDLSRSAPDPSRWLFTDEALQQASPPPVAAHRASRLARHTQELGAYGVHDLTCSIGADLVALAATGILTVGSDIDTVRLMMANHNVTSEGFTPRLVRADARTRTSRGLIRYADPARRDGSGRRTLQTIPSVAELDAADPHDPPVLRLPPAADFAAMGRAGEIELVSWRGVVREAVSWPPAMATARRRATVLGDGGVIDQYTDTDDADDDVVPGERVGRYLVDPDPAVVRAHLVQQYAARHGLRRIDEHLAYLTGDRRPPKVRSFEILDSGPFSERTVRDWVRRDSVGTLEIKQRGTPIVPDDLRKRLRPSGDRACGRTLIVARVGRAMRAYWTVALPPPT